MGKRDRFDDPQLVQAIAQGGPAREQAMRQLYQDHLPAGLRYLRKLGSDDEQSRDIFQDAVVQLMLTVEAGKFQGQSSLRTYLFAISKNLWYSRLRRQDVELRYREGLTPEEERVLAQTPEVRLMDSHQRDLVQAVLGQLGDACRQVLTLWSFKYDMREIAAQLGYANEQIARNKKSKCLRRLKEMVKQRPAVRSLVRELIS